MWPQSGPLESLRVVNVGEGWRKRERATTWCVVSAFPRPSGHEVLYFEPPNTPGLMETHHKKRCPLSASVPKNYRAPRGIPVHHSPSPKRIPCAVGERIQPRRCSRHPVARRGQGTADPNQICPSRSGWDLITAAKPQRGAPAPFLLTPTTAAPPAGTRLEHPRHRARRLREALRQFRNCFVPAPFSVSTKAPALAYFFYFMFFFYFFFSSSQICTKLSSTLSSRPATASPPGIRVLPVPERTGAGRGTRLLEILDAAWVPPLPQC